MNLESGPRISMKLTMIALNKEPKATKFSHYHIISLITHTAKTVARILRRRIETTIEDVLGLEHLGFRTVEGTRYAIGMLKLISEQTLEIDDKLCACFLDLQKVSDPVKWTKLIQILKKAVIDWCKRRLITELYRDQSVKV